MPQHAAACRSVPQHAAAQEIFPRDRTSLEGGPGCYVQVSKIGPLMLLVRIGLFSHCQGLAENLRFSREPCRPPETLGLLLGDHLVTMAVRINSCSTN